MRERRFKESRTSARQLRLLLLFSAFFLTSFKALADASGDGGGSMCVDDAGNTCDAGVPLACDGGLCDTTNGSGCSSVNRSTDFGLIAISLAVLAFALTQRRIFRDAPRVERPG